MSAGKLEQVAQGRRKLTIELLQYSSCCRGYLPKPVTGHSKNAKNSKDSGPNPTERFTGRYTTPHSL